MLTWVGRLTLTMSDWGGKLEITNRDLLKLLSLLSLICDTSTDTAMVD